jgi:hypothetical protein
VVHPAADLVQFVQRREISAYEQRVARAAYAYGVDLRRSSWLDHSTLGDPLMRAVDRRWNGLVAGLQEELLAPPQQPVAISLMEHVLSIAQLLRAPVPTLRLLHEPAPDDVKWPPVTPLGTTKGGMHWLILDAKTLMAESKERRAFLLGAALGHLQCDHGPLFAAHLFAFRSGRALGVVRRLLSPWSRVAVFSADRAGLLAAGALDVALDTLRSSASESPPFFPPTPALAIRQTALEEFDRSAVVTRLRALRARAAGKNDQPPVVPDEPRDSETSETNDENDAEDAGKATDPNADLDNALKDAWSLARCDERLTRRLGLL